jgi:hypothetical protein
MTMDIRRKAKLLRTRIRRRLCGYKNPKHNHVFMLESDFKGIFAKYMERYGAETYEELINRANYEDLTAINQGIDKYQICKKEGI